MDVRQDLTTRCRSTSPIRQPTPVVPAADASTADRTGFGGPPLSAWQITVGRAKQCPAQNLYRC